MSREESELQQNGSEPEIRKSDPDRKSSGIPPEPESATIQSGVDADPKDKDEGSRTFTMRELLDELKNGDDSEPHNPDAATPRRYV